MKFILQPSLERMALVKIAISLWNQNDVRALISKLSSGILNLNEKWKTIEERVIEKVPHLSLPQLLKGKVLGFIKLIGLQIRGWMQFQCRSFLPAQLPAEFCWTPHGTIDRKKTAEVLIKDKNLDTSTCYKLACIYCLEDDINKFWNNMPEILKESISNRSRIINFWSHNMKKGGVGHISYKNAFHQSACWGNKVAAEYFLQKLTPQEREESLVETAKSVTDADVLCFILSEMEDEQQKIILKNSSCEVLKYFLQWPLQSLFIGVANCLWDFLSTSDYDCLLRNIIIKDTDGYKDWNYRELFREFWQESPNTLKSSFTDELDQGYLDLLTFLSHNKDKENIRLILKNATLATKDKLIYSYKMNTLFESFIRDDEWDFLEFFIRECLPTKNEMLKFKDEFEERSSCFKGYFARNKYKWDKLFHFPDNSISLFNKRSIDECSSSKRFCSQQISVEEGECSSSKRVCSQQISIEEGKCSSSKRFHSQQRTVEGKCNSSKQFHSQ